MKVAPGIRGSTTIGCREGTLLWEYPAVTKKCNNKHNLTYHFVLYKGMLQIELFVQYEVFKLNYFEFEGWTEDA